MEVPSWENTGKERLVQAQKVAMNPGNGSKDLIVDHQKTYGAHLGRSCTRSVSHCTRSQGSTCSLPSRPSSRRRRLGYSSRHCPDDPLACWFPSERVCSSSASHSKAHWACSPPQLSPRPITLSSCADAGSTYIGVPMTENAVEMLLVQSCWMRCSFSVRHFAANM
jgi:hypothetical protein